MSKTLKFDLLENGVDYLLSGVEHLNAKEARSHKYAILHLAAGVELILKHVIKEEHWSLLFEDPSKANKSNLDTGDFKSIEFESIWNRLKNVCGIDIGQSDHLTLKSLRNLRNRIQHFNVDINILAVRAECSQVLAFLLGFIDNEVDITGQSESAKTDLAIFSKKD